MCLSLANIKAQVMGKSSLDYRGLMDEMQTCFAQLVLMQLCKYNLQIVNFMTVIMQVTTSQKCCPHPKMPFKANATSIIKRVIKRWVALLTKVTVEATTTVTTPVKMVVAAAIEAVKN